MRFLPLAFSFLFFFSSEVRAENKFNFATTPGKLPKDIRPNEYAVRIQPDLERLTFTGAETIKLDVQKPVMKLVLNALELEISFVSLDGKPLPKKAIALNAGEQTLTLVFARANFPERSTSARPANFAAKSIRRARAFSMPVIRRRGLTKRKTPSCWARNSKRPMRGE